MVKLKEDKFHVIKAERWELVRKKKRYIRANNLHQPGTIRVYIPHKRIVRINIEFLDGSYKIYRGVVFEREK